MRDKTMEEAMDRQFCRLTHWNIWRHLMSLVVFIRGHDNRASDSRLDMNFCRCFISWYTCVLVHGLQFILCMHNESFRLKNAEIE